MNEVLVNHCFEADIGAWKKSKRILLKAQEKNAALKEARERLNEVKDIFIDCSPYIVKILCNGHVIWRFDIDD
jgi:hypothetical protein